ncbi:hypothetical protein GEMRC1_004895 [Eukaryota sp. GEM-RC1]
MQVSLSCLHDVATALSVNYLSALFCLVSSEMNVDKCLNSPHLLDPDLNVSQALQHFESISTQCSSDELITSLSLSLEIPVDDWNYLTSLLYDNMPSSSDPESSFRLLCTSLQAPDVNSLKTIIPSILSVQVLDDETEDDLEIDLDDFNDAMPVSETLERSHETSDDDDVGDDVVVDSEPIVSSEILQPEQSQEPEEFFEEEEEEEEDSLEVCMDDYVPVNFHQEQSESEEEIESEQEKEEEEVREKSKEDDVINNVTDVVTGSSLKISSVDPLLEDLDDDEVCESEVESDCYNDFKAQSSSSDDEETDSDDTESENQTRAVFELKNDSDSDMTPNEQSNLIEEPTHEIEKEPEVNAPPSVQTVQSNFDTNSQSLNHDMVDVTDDVSDSSTSSEPLPIVYFKPKPELISKEDLSRNVDQLLTKLESIKTSQRFLNSSKKLVLEYFLNKNVHNDYSDQESLPPPPSSAIDLVDQAAALTRRSVVSRRRLLGKMSHVLKKGVLDEQTLFGISVEALI